MNPDAARKQQRPDLSEKQIASMFGALVIVIGLIALWPDKPAPGSAFGQWAAAAGAILLLAPALFLVMKRSGASESPPTWFVVHVLSTLLGCSLIFIHVAAADWLTPPGLVLLLLGLLIVQGSLLRTMISRGFSLLFARSSDAAGFSRPAGLDKTALRALIETKIELLERLDHTAEEALFSPALKHWLRHPLLSLRYQLLANREARMIGARASAGAGLSWSRRLHLLIALGFYLGLIAHVIVVLFFAGYAAEGGDIDWWYLTDWGR